MTRTGDFYTADIPLSTGEHQYRFHVAYPDGSSKPALDYMWPYYVADLNANVGNILQFDGTKRVAPPNMEKFRFPDLGAMEVYLASDFNNWRYNQIRMLYTDEDLGMYDCWLRFPRPFAYKFVADGEWFTDVQSAPGIEMRPNTFGGLNSFRPALESQALATPTADPSTPATIQLPVGESYAIERIRKVAFVERNYSEAIRMVTASQQAARARAKVGNNHAAANFDTLRLFVLEGEIHKLFGETVLSAEAFARVVAAEGIPRDETRQAWYDLAKYLQYVEHDRAGTRSLFNDLLATAPDQRVAASVLVDIARIARDRLNWELLIATVLHAMEIAPGPRTADAQWKHFWAEAHVLISIGYRFSKKLDEAKHHLEQALALIDDREHPLAVEARNYRDAIINHPETASIGPWEIRTKQRMGS